MTPYYVHGLVNQESGELFDVADAWYLNLTQAQAAASQLNAEIDEELGALDPCRWVTFELREPLP